MAPSWVGNPAYDDIFGAIERACMSPGMARSVLQGYHGHDARDAAAAVHVPTLVLHCEGDGLVPVEWGRVLARHIEGARFQELAGPDHFVWIHNSEAVPDAIQAFVTGQPAAPYDDDRILTTIVFTDIVDSTARLADTGDAAWRTLLTEHDRRMDELLVRFGGEAVKHTGDGRLVHFARPARAVRFAAAMVDAARTTGLEIRAGIHTGECELVGGDLFGLAVNIAARIAAKAGANEVLVSPTVQDLVVGSGLRFEQTGEHELKGAPGRWALHRLQSDRPGPLVAAGYDTDVRVPAEA
jgi:class 3 adenylate cyclase